jgi:hypothetical protein
VGQDVFSNGEVPPDIPTVYLNQEADNQEYHKSQEAYGGPQAGRGPRVFLRGEITLVQLVISHFYNLSGTVV